MINKEDWGVKNLAETRPRLRSELKFTYQVYAHVPSYVIEDPISNKFYRVGLEEYRFISLLNGRNSMAEALAIIAETVGQEALTEDEASQILGWLQEKNLLESQLPVRPAPEDKKDSEKRPVWERFLSQMITCKIPLGNPDRFFDKVSPFFRFFLGIPFALLWVLLQIIVLYFIFANWDRFVFSSHGFLKMSNWLWLYISWIVLKAIHELGHGIVCKHYGGNVPEIGILLILLSPIGYVETTSVWGFPSKWQRIHVSIAGMFFELSVAALAALVWVHSESPVVQHISYNLMIMASITTIFFNLNPLMRLDGYYILMDFLEKPNLYTRSQGYLLYLGKRYLLGVDSQFPSSSWKDKYLLILYGILSLVWRIFLYTTLILAASSLLLGTGILLALIAVFVWLLLPILRVFHYIFWGSGVEKPDIIRFSIICFLSIFILYSGFIHLSYQPTFVAVAITVYQKEEVLRTHCPGFVKKIYAKTNQRVNPGKQLGELENLEMKAKLEDLEKEIALTQIQIRIYEQNHKAAAQAQKEALLSLEKQHKEIQQFVQSLRLKAGIAGIVTTRNLENRLGQYLSTGSEFLTIADPDSKILRAFISQEDVEPFRAALNKEVEVFVPGHEDSFLGILNYVAPRADAHVFHPALSSMAGGPLLVMSHGKEEVLATPHLVAEIQIPLLWKNRLKAGESGFIKVAEEHKVLWYHFYFCIEKFFQKISEAIG